MITGLDHVVVLTGDIAAGEAAYQSLFARTPAWRNSGDGAERVLFTLDNMTLELMAPSGDRRGRGPDPRRAGGARRGTGEPLLSHQRHRENASPARPADAEAGTGRRGRKPRSDLGGDPVVEAHPRGHRCDARRPAVLPRTGERAPALGANRACVDHRDGPCGGLDPGSRARRRAVWRAARARHGARPFASGLGPADVLPLRRPHRRGHASAGQAGGCASTTDCEGCAGASPTSTPPMRG